MGQTTTGGWSPIRAASWHHPEVGVELATDSGRCYFAIWGSIKGGEFELKFAEGSLAAEWLPSREGRERGWDVSDHPRWREILASPVIDVGVAAAMLGDSPPTAAVSVRITTENGGAWIVAAGPKNPPEYGDVPSLETMAVGFNEVVVLFESDHADALRLNERVEEIGG